MTARGRRAPRAFVVVIPSYNNARWYRRNLESVLLQDYPRFRVIYVDDASPDGTGELVAELLAEGGHEDRVTLCRNEDRLGAAANIDRAVRTCDPGEVVVLVDGDDFLAHPRVLQRLDVLYRDPDVWVTWGQFLRYPAGEDGFCDSIPAEIVSANAYRDYPFVSSHLRTFYAGLYQRIHPADLQDSDGRFYSIAGDVAHMFALMEMAGARARFVPEVLYLYNRENPINDDKIDRARQVRTEMEIRQKVRYGRVASLTSDAPRELCFSSGMGRSLFDGAGEAESGEERRRPFRQLRAVLNRLGYTVRETQSAAEIDDAHHLVVFDVRPKEIEALAARRDRGRTLVLWLDPISAPSNFDQRYHRPFDRIFTWCDDLVDGERYFKLHFPYLRPMIADVVPFEKRKLCVLLASRRTSDHPDQLYGRERKLAEFFAAAVPDSFDLFGWGWSRDLDRGYRGIVANRVNRLRAYRFSFCYETVGGWRGLVTGKIFDSFAAGCVPVYLGAPDVAQSIPRDCFVAREDFRSEAELYDYLRDMPERDHEGYLDRIRAFLSSERAVPFSSGRFIGHFVALLGGRAAAAEPAGDRLASTDGRVAVAAGLSP